MRSFTLETAALVLLAAIALIMLVLLGHVHAEPLTARTFQDSMGREIGRADTHGNNNDVPRQHGPRNWPRCAERQWYDVLRQLWSANGPIKSQSLSTLNA